jgi:hypothetical protein
VKPDGEASNDEEIVEVDVHDNVREMKADSVLVALASKELVKDGRPPSPQFARRVSHQSHDTTTAISKLGSV